ncbi:MAG TPA: beta-L-arabinofuranosidase domain-containing protein [Candidatus Dormibacteraeota bacterium]|nr:beta-L-arabinofuranosidase domain-containing protein [Candidatus Dormibacteraeota bacterium]
MQAPRFTTLPPQHIRARGWLQEQLRLSAAGLTGRMMEIWPDVGADSGWLGGGGENWERGPYYARGLIGLAHALGDADLQARAAPWVEWSLASQRDDGWFGPAGNDDWWARMPMLDALRWHAEATGDPRVAPFLARYLRYQLAHLPARPLELWGKPRGGDNLDAVLWLHDRTGEPWLRELAALLHAQTSDWIGELGGDGPPSQEFDFGHGVNRAMGLKEPALWWRCAGDPAHLAAVRRGWLRVMEHHGQVQGLYSGDEFLHGRGATQGTELCTIVELLASLERVLCIGGEAWAADAIERMAYNALPAILSADHCAHQYFQLPNQVECTPGNRNFWVPHETDLLFGTATGYGCCAANLHMGWPRLVQHLWLRAADGLCAPLLAPSVVTAAIAGRAVTIEEETSYPFDGALTFTVRCTAPTAFALSWRVPSWVAGGEVEEPGARARPLDARAGWARVEREWRDGDRLHVRLPMPLRTSRWDRAAVAVERGPLVFALRISEEWRAVSGTPPFADYELRPTTAWNYALVLDPAAPERTIRVEPRSGTAQPWSPDGTPVVLQARARRVPGWVVEGGAAGPVPEPPVAAAEGEETVELVPFGAARLRISQFPAIQSQG